MLRLFQSIFNVESEPSAVYDKALIERATERVVDGTDPRLRALTGLHRKLRPAVETAVDHIIRLADSFPPAIEFSRARFSRDERIRAFFASPDHLRDVLDKSAALHDYMDRPRDPQADRAYAFLGVQRQERNILGMELEGELIRRDVAQVVVNFSQHRIVGVMDSEPASRLEIKKRGFDHLIAAALRGIVEERTRRFDTPREHEMLKRKLQALQEAHWGMGAVIDPEGEIPADIQSIERQIGAMELEIKQTSVTPMNLDHSIELISATLGTPQEHIRVEKISLTLDPMGVKVENKSAVSASTLQLDEISFSDGRRVIPLPVWIPVAEIPPAAQFFAGGEPLPVTLMTQGMVAFIKVKRPGCLIPSPAYTCQ